MEDFFVFLACLEEKKEVIFVVFSSLIPSI